MDHGSPVAGSPAPTRREKGKPASKSVLRDGKRLSRRVKAAVLAGPPPQGCFSQLTVNLGGQRRYPWTFMLANDPTGILGIDFLQYYELLVDSRRLQLITPASNIKVTGLKTRTDVYRITGLMPDIPVDFQTPDVYRITGLMPDIPVDFQTLNARFPTLTKPIEDLTLMTDR
ncbi:unnamed protein product, partial [Echinostoma caproni]|uniref:Peptidase A2 domain-containing protein n=1 Tax=Echinostoma caproni TaxID=27848 RepID=A0A183A4U9_9TREM